MTQLSDKGANSFHVTGSDTSMGQGSWDLVTRTAFTQLTLPESLRIISSNTADSGRVKIYGIRDTDSSIANTVMRLSGTDSVFGRFAATESRNYKWKFVAFAVMDTEAAGTVTIVGHRTGVVTTIRPGHLETETAQIFSGRRPLMISGWGAEGDTLSTVEAELRYYPSFADSRHTPQTGYRILDASRLRPGDGAGGRYRQFLPADARWTIESAGYLAVFARGTSTTKVHNAFIDAYEP